MSAEFAVLGNDLQRKFLHHCSTRLLAWEEVVDFCHGRIDYKTMLDGLEFAPFALVPLGVVVYPMTESVVAPLVMTRSVRLTVVVVVVADCVDWIRP